MKTIGLILGLLFLGCGGEPLTVGERGDPCDGVTVNCAGELLCVGDGAQPSCQPACATDADCGPSARCASATDIGGAPMLVCLPR